MRLTLRVPFQVLTAWSSVSGRLLALGYSSLRIRKLTFSWRFSSIHGVGVGGTFVSAEVNGQLIFLGFPVSRKLVLRPEVSLRATVFLEWGLYVITNTWHTCRRPQPARCQLRADQPKTCGRGFRCPARSAFLDSSALTRGHPVSVAPRGSGLFCPWSPLVDTSPVND